MHRLILLCYILFLLATCNSVEAQIISGRAIDSQTREAIPFVHITSIDSSYGAVSKNDGSFLLEIPDDQEIDTLLFSSIGYESKRIPTKYFQKDTIAEIKLRPKTYDIGDIVVEAGQLRTYTLGTKFTPLLKWGYLGARAPDPNYSSRYAIKLSWEKSLPFHFTNTRLHLAKDGGVDTLTMRVYLAAIDSATGRPGTILTKKNIVKQFTVEDGWLTFDLRDYNFWINEREFFLIYEWVPPRSNAGNVLPAFTTKLGRTGFYFANCADEWNHYAHNLLFSMEGAYKN